MLSKQNFKLNLILFWSLHLFCSIVSQFNIICQQFFSHKHSLVSLLQWWNSCWEDISLLAFWYHLRICTSQSSSIQPDKKYQKNIGYIHNLCNRSCCERAGLYACLHLPLVLVDMGLSLDHDFSFYVLSCSQIKDWGRSKVKLISGHTSVLYWSNLLSNKFYAPKIAKLSFLNLGPILS